MAITDAEPTQIEAAAPPKPPDLPASGPQADANHAATPPQSLGRYPWIAMAVVLSGAYMVILDLTVLGVALSDIGTDLGTNLSPEWVITSYLVAVGIVQPGTGWVADKFGRKRVFMTSLTLFAVGSLLAGLAPSIGFLIGARVVQGLGGGLLMPIGMAMVLELFSPSKRGTALGVWGVAMMAAPALGPPVGGWLTESVSWRWIFLINIPIGLVSLLLARRYLRDIGFRQNRALDLLSWIMTGLGITAVVFASRLAGDIGLTHPATIGVFLAGLAMIIFVVKRSLRRKDPIIEFRIFKSAAFSVTLGVVAFISIAQFARLTYLPVELQTVRGMSPDEIGLLLAPAALGVAATMTFGGWLADRIGPRIPVVTGLVLVAAGTWFLAHLRPDTDPGLITAMLVVSGVGTGLSLMPNTVAAMNSVRTRYLAEASAVRAINREIAAALGTAILGAIIVSQLGSIVPAEASAAGAEAVQSTYNTIFTVAFYCIIAAIALALFIPGRKKMKEFQKARAVEHRALLEQEAGLAPARQHQRC